MIYAILLIILTSGPGYSVEEWYAPIPLDECFTLAWEARTIPNVERVFCQTLGELGDGS